MSEGTRRRLAAIVAADVAGYSRLVGLDEEGTLAALRSLRKGLIDPLLAKHGGRIANTAGDSLLLEFPSIVDAVRCSISFQEGMLDRYRGIDDDKSIRFRVGIHLGDVIAEGSDLLGDGVNVAARSKRTAWGRKSARDIRPVATAAAQSYEASPHAPTSRNVLW